MDPFTLAIIGSGAQVAIESVVGGINKKLRKECTIDVAPNLEFLCHKNGDSIAMYIRIKNHSRHWLKSTVTVTYLSQSFYPTSSNTENLCSLSFPRIAPDLQSEPQSIGEFRLDIDELDEASIKVELVYRNADEDEKYVTRTFFEGHPKDLLEISKGLYPDLDNIDLHLSIMRPITRYMEFLEHKISEAKKDLDEDSLLQYNEDLKEYLEFLKDKQRMFSQWVGTSRFTQITVRNWSENTSYNDVRFRIKFPIRIDMIRCRKALDFDPAIFAPPKFIPRVFETQMTPFQRMNVELARNVLNKIQTPSNELSMDLQQHFSKANHNMDHVMFHSDISSESRLLSVDTLEFSIERLDLDSSIDLASGECDFTLIALDNSIMKEDYLDCHLELLSDQFGKIEKSIRVKLENMA